MEYTDKTANTASYADQIAARYDAYRQQQENAVDYKTETGVNQARRDYESAVPAYEAQYRDATAKLYQGMDNAALEARAAGEYGGMGAARVSAVQGDYQDLRSSLAQAQRALATDTAEAIEALRSQGEFDKADALLTARQMELYDLYEDAVRADENSWRNSQYETALRREDESGERTYYRSLGQAFLDAGVMPPEALLSAMGLSPELAQRYIEAVQMGY